MFSQVRRIALAPSAFERWAADYRLDLAPAVVPTATRVYADLATQVLFEAWSAGAASVARTLTESTLETPALRERIRAYANYP
jgi:hypothetical protein